jgi:ankyrin repeat protein
MYATFKQDPALVKLYLEAGADAHAVSKDGDTALDFAKGKNKKKIRCEALDKNQEIIEMLQAIPLPAVPLPTAVSTLPLLEASSQLMDMICSKD